MKNKPTEVPEIIKNINPVTEQFGPISQDLDQMQIPDTVKEVPGFVYKLLTSADQTLCDKATD